MAKRITEDVRRVDPKFIAEMDRKLDQGRSMGYCGWDDGWGEEVWELLRRLHDEADELVQAMPGRADNGFLTTLQQRAILSECADIANFAMFIADYFGSLKLKSMNGNGKSNGKH